MRWFCWFLAVSACNWVASSAVAEEPPPNVILFLVDDLGWRDLSCQGSDYYRTPNIDRLAAEGVRFTNAYAACAVCSPTRAAILTGKYPARLMLTQWLPAGRWDPKKNQEKEGRFLRQLPLEEVTLAEALRPRYRTIHVGKWHLGGAPFSLPEQHGFDVNIAGSDHGAPGSYFYPYEGSWLVPTTGQKVLKQTLPDGKQGEYLTDRLTDEAIHLIEAESEKPFFLYFPFYAVHTPLQAPKDRVEPFAAVSKEKQQGNPTYAAMVASVDMAVGRVLRTLEEKSLRDDTLIILTSDNGGFAKATDNAPLRANKGSFYEGGIRVPLIFHGLDVRKGVVCEDPVISTDLYPTILGLTGSAKQEKQTVDGRDLTPFLVQGESVETVPLFWHYPHYNQHPQSFPVSIIRKGDWKLLEFLESDTVELYNLAEDEGEEQDLSSEKPELVAELRRELEAWREETGAEPMRDNPQYQP